MAIGVNSNFKIYIDGYDVSGDSNKIDVSQKVEMLDATVFGSSGRRRLPGLKDFTVSVAGFWSASSGIPTMAKTTYGEIEPAAFNRLIGRSSAVITIAESSQPGKVAYMGRLLASEASPAGKVGDILGFTIVASGDDRLVSGKLLETGNISTGITATITDMGPLSTQDNLYAAVHVFGTTDAASHKFNFSVQGSSSATFGSINSTLFKWARANFDATTTPGTAKWASTKVSSTKLRYSRIAVKSSAGSTNTKFRMAVALGVGQR